MNVPQSAISRSEVRYFLVDAQFHDWPVEGVQKQQSDGAQWGAVRHTISTQKNGTGVTFICLQKEEKV